MTIIDWQKRKRIEENRIANGYNTGKRSDKCRPGCNGGCYWCMPFKDCRTEQLKGLEGRRVEVVTEDGDIRRFWVSTNQLSAPMLIHLEIKTTRSTGGASADGHYQSVKVIR